VIVNRTIHLNPVEPEFVAFRLSQGIETKIDFTFLKQTGAAHNEDLVAQMQLTSRSGHQTEYFSVPSIDMANGRARAVIPAGFGYDPNGWQLRLTGTVNQEPRVIAYGVVTALAGAGPQAEPQDVIDSIDITLFYGQPTLFVVKVWKDETKQAPFDLATASITAVVTAGQGGAVLVPFTVSEVTVNSVTLTLTAEQVDTLPPLCWWWMALSTGTGMTTLAEGEVTVRTLVIPP
jgi:hypothetical protein